VTDADHSTDHYSYAVYADPAMADQFEAARFGGPIGRLLAETQEQQIAAFLAPLEGRRVLDVGTGTGRAAIALARRGAQVTGVDASAEMLAVAERRAHDASVHVDFRRDDAHHLAFPDRAFDAVVCLRVLMHTPDWHQSFAELCRVSSRHVVVDFPAALSAAAIQAGVRRVMKPFSPKTEAYRVFSMARMTAAIESNGFRLVAQHRQFVLPIAIHKRVASRAWTERVEGALARAGLLRLAGSPVTILIERCES
jgi:ubiquinone/menaquinone biosynthesis C-methylase UbiE